MLESHDINDPLKQDKKGKKVLIEASGFVAGQMLANTKAWKKDKARGSSHPLVEPESSPTLLMGIDDLSMTVDWDLNMHQWAMKNLENILSNDEEELEFSEDSMAEPDEFDHAMDMNDEIEDSTTLRRYQEGIRKESLARKRSALQMISQKKGKLGDNDDGDPIRISRPQPPSV